MTTSAIKSNLGIIVAVGFDAAFKGMIGSSNKAGIRSKKKESHGE